MTPLRVQRVVKRLIDVLAAVVLLVLTAPLLAGAAVLIRVQLGSPVLYRQQRTGRDLRPFLVLKLRTMVEDRDHQGRPVPGSARCVGVGRLLRKWSVNELPQLVNVIRGELSLIGPRPLMSRYDPWFTARERIRFAVRPGITGLAQVAGRNQVAWDRRLELDVQYVLNWSLWLDLRIALRTVGMLLTGRGVVEGPAMPMLDLDQERRLRRDRQVSAR